MSELGRVRDKASWRDTLLSVLRAWNRHQVWKILTAIVVIWLVSGTALHFAERGTNPAFETWRESLWNVWVTLFSGLNNAPNSRVGRLVVSGVLVVGVALAGLFTASVASILIERSLRSREVSNLEMSDHLVLCNWSPRALDWIREVGFDHGVGHPLLLLYDAKTPRGQKGKEFNGLGDNPFNASVSLFQIMTKYFIRITI